MQAELKARLQQILASPAQRIHLIGVCGSGMSGLARLLLAQGHAVSGSDLVSASLAANYVPEGVTYFEGHRVSNVDNAALVVFSSAIAEENLERRAVSRILSNHIEATRCDSGTIPG